MEWFVETQEQLTDGLGGIPAGLLDNDDRFGSSLAALGDLDGDGVDDMAVGSPSDSDSLEGSVTIVFLKEDGTAKGVTKISEGTGAFTGNLDVGDRFGSSVASLGDLDGDGVEDLAVGAATDVDAGCCNRGSVWILFLNNDGTVKTSLQLLEGLNGLPAGSIDNDDRFGSAIAVIGDLDSDGVADLAVGSPSDDDSLPGSVSVVFMNTDGTAKTVSKVGAGVGGFSGELDVGDRFGSAITGLGDLDGDGVPDIAVGAATDADAGCCDRGSIWILFLNSDGSVKAEQMITDGIGGLPAGTLQSGDRFGSAVARYYDVDGNGAVDIFVGAPSDGSAAGSVHLLFLNVDGTVLGIQRVDEAESGFTGIVDVGDGLGSSVAGLGDLDGNGAPDVAIGAANDADAGCCNRGAVWVLLVRGLVAVPTARGAGLLVGAVVVLGVGAFGARRME